MEKSWKFLSYLGGYPGINFLIFSANCHFSIISNKKSFIFTFDDWISLSQKSTFKPPQI